MSITDQLEEERCIINAATAGPWITEWHGDDWWYSIYGAAAGEEVLPEVATLDYRESKADAEFIAHARTALPIRNAQVEAVRKVADDLDAEADNIFGNADVRLNAAVWAMRIRRAIEEAGA